MMPCLVARVHMNVRYADSMLLRIARSMSRLPLDLTDVVDRWMELGDELEGGINTTR